MAFNFQILTYQILGWGLYSIGSYSLITLYRKTIGLIVPAVILIFLAIYLIHLAMDSQRLQGFSRGMQSMRYLATLFIIPGLIALSLKSSIRLTVLLFGIRALNIGLFFLVLMIVLSSGFYLKQRISSLSI